MSEVPAIAAAPSLAALLAQQRAHWERCERIPTETFLARHPGLAGDADAILDLICNELLLRLESGEKPRLAEYLHRFPQWESELRIQFQVEFAVEEEGRQTEQREPPGNRQQAVSTTQTSETPTLFPSNRSEGDASAIKPGGPGPQIPGYEIIHEIARGGQSVVCLARQLSLNRLVALKMILGGVAADPAELARFRREALAVAQLKHPHIVQIYDIGEEVGETYLALEFVGGGTLTRRIGGLPQPAREAAALVETLARTMHWAHEHGIVHRDLKPGNVLLTEDGTPKIADFGLAKSTKPGADLTQTGNIMGTPAYMAPEQAAGKNNTVGPAADIYALGAILYEMLTGRPPFVGEAAWDVVTQVLDAEPAAPRSLQPNVPRDLETICLTCLDKKPARRYASALGLAADLHRFQTGEPIQARPVSTLERSWRWCLRRPTQALAIVLAATTFSAVAILTTEYAFARQQSASAEKLREEQIQTKAALADAERYRRRAEELSTDLVLQRGLTLCEQGDSSQGLLWIARALEIAPAHRTDLQESIRGNLAAWRRRSHSLRAVLWHPAEVFAAAFNPAGNMIVTGIDDGTAWRWDVATGKQIGSPLRKHKDLIHAVAFSPSGKRLATTSADGTVQLWDTMTGQALGPSLPNDVPHFGGEGPSVAFSPDDKFVLTAGDGKTAQLRSVDTGALMGGPLEHRKKICAVAFSPDGKTIATASHDTTVRLWDAATGKALGMPWPHVNSVNLVAFRPDGKVVLTACTDHAARLWDVATGTQIGAPLQHRDNLWAMAFSSDNKTIATASADGTARLWSASDGSPIGAVLQHSERVCAVVFSPDSQTVLTGSFDRTAQLWESATGKRVGPPLSHGDVVRTVAFSPDGKSVLTGGRDRTVRVWEASIRTDLEVLLPHEAPVTSVAYRSDGQRVLTGSEDQSAQLWDAKGNRRAAPWKHRGAVRCVAFSNDGTLALTAGDDSTARVWDAATGAALGKPIIHPDFVRAAAFSPDGKIVATGNRDSTARLWETVTGKPIGPPLKHEKLLNALAFSPDGTIVVTASDDRTARRWTTADGLSLGLPLPHGRDVWAVVFSPDGKTVLTGGPDNTARLWDVNGRSVGSPMPHQGAVRAVAFSPDGKLVATASYDGTARLWDATSGKPLCKPLVHQNRVLAVAFSPDGKILATASADGTARMWDAGTAEPFRMPLRHRGPVLAIAFSPDGQTLLTGSYDGNARLWRWPAPVEGDKRRLNRWIQVLTGMELDGDGFVHVLDAPTWRQRREQLGDFDDPPRLP